MWWSGTIRFIMEGYMEIILATCLNVAKLDTDTTYKAVLFTNWFSPIMFAIVLGLPIWICVFFWIKVEYWHDEDFQSKYGAILEGTRTEYKSCEEGKTWIAVMFPVLTLARRVGFVISVIFWPDFTWLQLAVTFTFI